MAEIVYILCAATSALCAALLLRTYKRTKARLLFWSSACFVGITLTNILLFVDLVILPQGPDLFLLRNLTTLFGLALLLYGLIWDNS